MGLKCAGQEAEHFKGLGFEARTLKRRKMKMGTEVMRRWVLFVKVFSEIY